MASEDGSQKETRQSLSVISHGFSELLSPFTKPVNARFPSKWRGDTQFDESRGNQGSHPRSIVMTDFVVRADERDQIVTESNVNSRCYAMVMRCGMRGEFVGQMIGLFFMRCGCGGNYRTRVI